MNEVALAILRGDADGHFDEVYAAVKQRQRSLATKLAASLRKGDRVRLVNIRPKKLVGLEGEIGTPNGRRGTRLPVILDDKVLQLAYGTPMYLLPACLERIS